MEDRAHALAAGLFTLLLGLAAAVFVWWLGQSREDMNYYVLEASENVSGLNNQAQVRYRGIRAGRVQSIDLDKDNPRLILVRISLDARYPLTMGTTAKLKSQGVTGLAYVQLEDEGSDPRPLVAGENGNLLRIALSPPLLDTLGEQAGDIAEQANVLASRLTRVLDERNLNNVSRTLENLAAASERLKDGMEAVHPVLASLRQTFSDENLKKLNVILANLEKTSGEAAPMVVELRETVRSVSALTARLDRLVAESGGQLTTTMLPRASDLMEELTVSARRLTRLTESLEREPRALVFGRGTIAPGPGEAGFVAPGASVAPGAPGH